ncbi:DUF342 domain-containing protein [Paenibacillus sp. 598K]|uniref:DUF342 domain-containing protein n=1 Tax=Paenibacillus sp. 598K TaxID=1117987 RepID=UPI000FFEFFA8|nr:FapA family protein [Paenibacillus sp. 598K]
MSSRMSEDQLFELISQLELEEDEGAMHDSRPPSIGMRSYLKVEDNRIHLISAGEEGEDPFIEAAPPLRLKINGELLSGRRQVRPDDLVEWELEETPQFQIKYSPDKMRAWFVLMARECRVLRLQDTPVSTDLLVQAEPVPYALPQRLTLIDIVPELEQSKLVQVDYQAIQRELDQPTYQPVLIAIGKEPTLGRDASLEIYFKEQIVSEFEEVNGMIDYRNHLKIPSVKANDLVARKIPLVPGAPGNDVFGAPIDPPRAKDIMMVAKNHIRITNYEAYALKEGRPRITGERIKLIDITTTHVLPGDVDMKTGNIVFSGDVIIYGNICDGMIVEALGDIYVMGNVYRATATATGSIYIKGNAIGSHLYSGHYGVLFNRLCTHSGSLNSQLQLMRNTMKQLSALAEARKQTVSPRQMFQLLLETKFKQIPLTIKEILLCISNIQQIQNGQLGVLKNKLLELMQRPVVVEVNLNKMLDELQFILIETVDSIKRCEELNVRTELQQCNMTSIMSGGDIVIKKQGVIQSQLFSKGNIVFHDQEAVCRGSQLEAEGAILAMTVGGKSGGSTMLKAGEKIVVSHMYEGRVAVGRFAKDILEPVEHMEFRVRQNRLVMHSTLDRNEEPDHA